MNTSKNSFVQGATRLAANALASLFFILLAFPANAATGRTAGTFGVSPSGSSTYTIPIYTVPGAHGFRPNIALTYDSQSDNGPFGMGWSLGGLSSISRCALTVAQDAAPAPITLTYSDRFCLNGNRLRLTSSTNLSTYGQAGTTYQTEIANFSNVTANGVAGNGPASFTVKGKDGLTYEYGVGGNSQVLATGSTTAVSWLLDKVTDRYGNILMTVSYTADIGSAVPATISWSPSASGYQYSINVTYTSTSEATGIGYVAGTRRQNSYLASKISVTGPGGAPVRSYQPVYETSHTTGRARLIQMTECVATDCLRPTQISYQDGAVGISSTPMTAPSAYDFNGDGLPDLIGSNGSQLTVALNTGSGFGTPINTNISYSTVAVMGDVLGTGSDGILAVNGSTFYYYVYQPGTNSFSSGVNTGAPYVSTNRYYLVDITGDGLPDLVSGSATGGIGITTFPNTTTNGVATFGASYSFSLPIDTTNFWRSFLFPGLDNSAEARRSVDFNGDGRKDVLFYVTRRKVLGGGELNFTYEYYELISQGAGAPFTVTRLPFDTTLDPAEVMGNFNDDGCTDVALGSTVYYSACNGTVATTVTLAGSPYLIGAMDWDGDGRTDILSGTTAGTPLVVYRSTGTDFNNQLSSNFTIPSGCGTSFLTGDANGDGLDDFGCNGTGIYVHSQAGHPADLLQKVTDGYDNSAAPGYVPLTQQATYTRGTDAPAGYSNFIAPLYVVNQVTLSDPSGATGATYAQTFKYQGGWLNLQGRGFSGFKRVQRYDSRTALWEKTIYDNLFPWTGIVDAVQISQDEAANQVISYSYINRTQTVLDATYYNQRYFPWVTDTTTQTYELGGSKNGQLVGTATTVYTFDNYGNATNVTTTRTDSDYGTPVGPASPYAGQAWTTTVATTITADPSNWCLGLPSHIQVTESVPGHTTPDVVRSVDFQPDYVHCNETSRTTEPVHTQYTLTESYLYDSFGNVSDVSVTGNTIAPRAIHTDWGATGQFPMSIRNALSQTTTFDYDFNLGFLKSATDPNNITVSWKSDAFGRKIREDRPDRTYTLWSYNDCANWGGCLIGTHALAVAQSVFNQDGSVQTDGSTWFDQADRPLLTNRRMLASGAYDRNEVRYDSLGRVKQIAMPCTYSAVTTPCTYWITNGFDAMGRILQTQRPVNANSGQGYCDPAQTPTPGVCQATTYTYLGRTRYIQDALGHTTTQVDDVNGWLRRTQDANGYALISQYDAAGSLTAVTDSAGKLLQSTTYAYGVGPFRVASTDADLGDWSYTVDALGETTNWKDANKQLFSMTFDALSRPVTRSEPDLFTQWAWGNSAGSFNIGQLQGVCTGTGSNPTACSASGYAESRSYDNLGRPSQRTITIPSDGSYTYTWQYSSNSGHVDTLTYPTISGYALKLQYAYVNGFLQSVTKISDTPSVALWTANAMNPAGQVTQETLGTSGSAVVTTRAIDAVTGWPSSVTSGVSGGAALQNESYFFDNLGNVTQRQNNNAGLTENFYYDTVNRLEHSTVNGNLNLQMGYDPMGNITSRSDVAGGSSWAYDPNKIHAVTQAGNASYGFGYDANGNAVSRYGFAVTWASYNHPTQINANGESVQFAYDHNHERYRAVYSGPNGVETTYFVGELLEKVVTAGANDYRHYVYVGGTKVAVFSRTSAGVNTLRYIREDHEGSVSAILNSDGTIYVKESFTAFGNRRNTCTWSGPPTNGQVARIEGVTRHGYTWQSMLGRMGLNDMNGRIQDANTGRFLSADPTSADADDTQSFNRYSYVDNNPLSYVDPTGFITIHSQRDDGAPDNEMESGSGVEHRDNQGHREPGGGGGGNGKSGSQEGLVKPKPPFPKPKCFASGCYIYHQMAVYDENGNLLSYTGGWSWSPAGGLGGLLFTSAGPGGGPGGGGAGGGNGGTAPQGNQNQQNRNRCGPGASLSLKAQQGLFAAFSAELTKIIGLDLDLDLGSYNTPSDGSTYLSHGIGVVLSIGPIKVGGSWEQRSYNGGLSFQSEPSNFIIGSFQASSEGVAFKVKPPQAFSGFEASVDNVLGLLPTGDTPCTP